MFCFLLPVKSIEGSQKITEIREGGKGGGGRGLCLRNPGRRGGHSDPENPRGRGEVKKPCHPSGVGGGVWIFSEITQCQIPR